MNKTYSTFYHKIQKGYKVGLIRSNSLAHVKRDIRMKRNNKILRTGDISRIVKYIKYEKFIYIIG